MKSDELYRQAKGKWHGLLSQVISERFLTGRHGPCPICGGKDRFRWDDKDGEGGYYCSQCGPGRGMTLMMKTMDWDYPQAAQYVQKYLGVVKVDDVKQRADPRPRLRRIMKEAVAVVPEGPVGEYLAGRGLSLIPPNIKMHPKLPYFDDQGSVLGVFPALVAIFHTPDMLAATIQVIYVHEGTKADVPHPKKTLPGVHRFDGGAIRLWQPNGQLAVAEGIETAIAAAEMLKVPAWATMNASLLASFQWPQDLEKLTVIADNDENFIGQAAAYKLASRAIKDVPTEVFMPERRGEDALDQLVRLKP